MRSALPVVVRNLGLLTSLLLLQCGPKQAEGDESGPGSGDTTVAASDTTGDTTSATTDPGTTAPTSAATEPSTTTGPGCEPPNDANVWVCECTTIDGPWTPFNEACGREPSAPIAWAEWLCEEYAGGDTVFTSSGAGSTAGDSTATAGETAGETAGDTGSLGCKCTCRVTPDCCDDSLP